MNRAGQSQPVQQQSASAAQPRRYDGQNGNPTYDTNAGGHYGTYPVHVYRDPPYIACVNVVAGHT
jgi:hypothetical protein